MPTAQNPAHHLIAEPAQIGRSHAIARHALVGRVAIAIDLDDQLDPLADEIHHIRPDRRLPPKMPAGLAPRMQQGPKPPLGRCLVPPQCSRESGFVFHGGLPEGG